MTGLLVRWPPLSRPPPPLPTRHAYYNNNNGNKLSAVCEISMATTRTCPATVTSLLAGPKTTHAGQVGHFARSRQTPPMMMMMMKMTTTGQCDDEQQQQVARPSWLCRCASKCRSLRVWLANQPTTTTNSALFQVQQAAALCRKLGGREEPKRLTTRRKRAESLCPLDEMAPSGLNRTKMAAKQAKFGAQMKPKPPRRG